MMRKVTGARISPLSLFHPVVLALVYPLVHLATGPLHPLARIAVVLVAGSAAYKVLAAVTGLIRRSDLATAEQALSTRAHVPHVRMALWGISVLGRLTRR
jgi:hypothetical protein